MKSPITKITKPQESIKQSKFKADERTKTIAAGSEIRGC